MARTSTKKDNRERARQRRAELDAERARRDAAIEEAASTFFDANDDREELIAKLDAIDVDRALAVQSLVELKETNPRIAQLLDIPVAEVRRLRDLGAESATPSANDGATSDVEASDGFVDAEHAGETGQAA
ncbi:hypothetical protein NYQ25_18720 [Curtobacterium flaccumfaciens pv. flaccumfaciens]|uniref:hypothetical protein n=1 Tax=Curtobacterium flaccumfaciens TaxID=2035 RepID=UPI00217E7961|nr:hypothetical protein [Curtobacterium flaccumfaciens]MCS6587007.1 hypothetical protein [Curtobacterium flaccumfaciens pv. flaccumfaciens]